MPAVALRVGVLIDRWEPARGGAERALAQLASHLEQRGHDVLVFAQRASEGAPGRFRRVSVLRPTRAARERALACALVAAAERERCDVTVGIRHLPRVDLFWPHGGAHLASLVAQRRAEGRAATVSAHHRVFLELEGELLDRGGARRVVCVSSTVRDELLEAHPACEERLVVVPNGVDLARFRIDARGPEREVPRITHVARNPELKGLPALLAALARLVDRPWELLVAGPRDPGRWLRRAAELGLEGRVTVEPERDALALAAGSDLLVHPAWRDPCPLCVLEALACGTPVVTTRATGAAEAVEAESGTVLDEPGDVEVLASAITHWLGRPVDRERVARCVAGRGLPDWLDRLEREIVGLA